MAIVDMKGTVSKDKPTMTGMMNETPKTVDAPKLSGMNKLFDNKQPVAAPIKEDAPMQKTAQAPSNDLISKVQNLPDEDKAVLSAVLSPSVSNALKKIAPELTPLLDQAGTSEENVIIPVSVVKSFATKRYGGQNETEAVTSFIADLQSSVPGMDNTMEQQSQPVPPDTQMANSEESMMQPEIDEIDSGMMEA